MAIAVSGLMGSLCVSDRQHLVIAFGFAREVKGPLKTPRPCSVVLFVVVTRVTRILNLFLLSIFLFKKISHIKQSLLSLCRTNRDRTNNDIFIWKVARSALILHFGWTRQRGEMQSVAVKVCLSATQLAGLRRGPAEYPTSVTGECNEAKVSWRL
jgi:hypothetical protein